MKQVSILGCGWLGLPLAKSLLRKGFLVKGSTTTSEKITVLENLGIQAFGIELTETEIKGEINSFLKDSEILIVDIPPKLRSTSSENFVKKIKTLIPFVAKSAVKKVIFISSTAVYSDHCTVVAETTQTEPDTENGKQLLEAEKLFQSHISNFSTTIVRFGGLIGEDRHPVYYLAGKQNLENPEAAVNLIHQIDCIGIIEKIIEQESRNMTFNAVAPFHPTRKEYYTQKAIEFGLPLPEFTEDATSFGKIIHSNLVESELHYQFQKPNL